MKIKNQIHKVNKEVKDKTIPRELGEKINDAWNKLPFYRKIPTTRNMNLFMKELNLNQEEKKIFKELFKK